MAAEQEADTDPMSADTTGTKGAKNPNELENDLNPVGESAASQTSENETLEESIQDFDEGSSKDLPNDQSIDYSEDGGDSSYYLQLDKVPFLMVSRIKRPVIRVYCFFVFDKLTVSFVPRLGSYISPLPCFNMTST